MARILLVTNEPDVTSAFGRSFERTGAGHDVLRAGTGEDAIGIIEAEHPALVLLDAELPDMSGLDVLERTHASRPVVVFLTGAGDVALGVKAMQLGAESFLTKPIAPAHLEIVVERALEKAQLRDLGRATETRHARAPMETFLGTSAPMRELAQQIELIARSERTVALLVGEAGVGKRRVARTIHALSARGGHPFLEVDCTTRPEEALDVELFGVERTANGPVPGLFEAADGGTLFLAEVAELPASLQPKLLTALESRRVRRSGGTREVTVDVRVVAATARDLANEVTEERFREDLYYRLGVMPLYLPPLRARAPEDLGETVRSLVAELGSGMPGAPSEVSADALALIGAYPWPGNVRELRNVLERALLLARGADAVRPQHLAAEVRGAGEELLAPHVSRTLSEVERAHIDRTLRAHGANRTRAARELGISRATLIKKIREYELGERPGVANRAGRTMHD